MKPLPEFAWSKTRAEAFEACEQAFVLRYLTSAGAEAPDAPDWKRELGVLKRLATRHQWAGRVVHSAIAGVLLSARAGRGGDGEAVLGRMHRVMREDFAASRARQYRRTRLRADFDGLVEHEYGDPVSADGWRAAWAVARRSLEWFLASPWPARARSLGASAWLEIDTADLRSAVFQLEGAKTWAIPDAVFREGPITRVVDWKSGALRPNDALQVQVQALGVHLRHGVPLEALQASLVSLSEGRELEVPLDARSLERARQVVRTTSAGMKRLWVPRAKGVKTTSLATCLSCPFRRPCGREVAVLQSLGGSRPRAASPTSQPAPPP